MKGKLVLVFGVLFVLGFLCGCTSVSGNVESAIAFSRPIPINNLIVGSFSYDINDTYIVRPDGSLVSAPSPTEKKGHEAYYEKKVTDNTGKSFIKIEMKSDYHIASYDELYLWAIRRATEKAGIKNIIGVKSFITTTTKQVAGVVVAWQNVTLTVYGESQ